MIERLLEQRDILADIAEIQYGEDWITNQEFWGSTTELQMQEVEASLHNLGWRYEASEDQIALGQIILAEILDKKNAK
jgi:hypothetical protein